MSTVRTVSTLIVLTLLLPALAVPTSALGPGVKLVVRSGDVAFPAGPLASGDLLTLGAFTVDAQGNAPAATVVFWSVEGGCGDIAPVSPDVDGKSTTALFDPTTTGAGGCRVRVSTQAAPAVPEETSGVDASNAVVGWSGVITVTAATVVESVRVRTAPGGAGVEMGGGSFSTDGTLTLTAAGYDHDFNFIDDVAATWTASDPTVVAFDATPAKTVTFQFVKPGSVTLTATFGGKSDATGVIAVATGAVASIKILDAASCAATQVTAFSTTTDVNTALHAVAFDADGNCLGAQSADWTVSGTGTGAFTPTSGATTSFNPAKTGAFTVTAKLTANTAIQSTADATFSAGAPAKFSVSATTVAATAAAPFSFPIAIQDADSNPTTFAGTRNVVFGSAAHTSSAAGNAPVCASAAFGATVAVSFSAGSATVSCTLRKAVSASALTITDTTFPVASISVSVAPGAKASIVGCMTGLGQTVTAGGCTGTPGPVTVGNPGFIATFTAYDAELNVASTFTGAAGTVSTTFSGASASWRGANQPTASSGSSEVAFGSPTNLVFSNGQATTMIKLYRAERTWVNATGAAGSGLLVNFPPVTVNPGGASTLAILVDCSPTLRNHDCVEADPTGSIDAVDGQQITLHAAQVDVFGNVLPSSFAVDWVIRLSDGTPGTASRGVPRFTVDVSQDLTVDISAASMPGRTATLTIDMA